MRRSKKCDNTFGNNFKNKPSAATTNSTPTTITSEGETLQPPRVETKKVKTIPEEIKEQMQQNAPAQHMQTPDEFTLNQPTANHHKTTLRSQTKISPQPPNLILTDGNSMPYLLANHHPTSTPHIIPPDYQISSGNATTNFKQLSLNQLIVNHIFDSPTVHHVFNEISGERETMDTLLQGSDGIDWSQSLCNE